MPSQVWLNNISFQNGWLLLSGPTIFVVSLKVCSHQTDALQFRNVFLLFPGVGAKTFSRFLIWFCALNGWARSVVRRRKLLKECEREREREREKHIKKDKQWNKVENVTMFFLDKTETWQHDVHTKPKCANKRRYLDRQAPS